MSAKLKAIEVPLAIVAAETDGMFPATKGYETEAILKGLKFHIRSICIVA
jgi:homoserine acetyltransferase